MAFRLKIDYNHFAETGTKAGWHGPNVPRFGVLHSTESWDRAGLTDIEGVMNTWDRGTGDRKGVGAHWVNDARGNLGQYVPPTQVAWHCMNRNTGSVGIEQIAFARFDLAKWKTRLRQLHSTARIIAHCKRKFNIPIVHDLNRGWSTHAEQSKAFGHGTRSDPGAGYPFRTVLALAKVYAVLGW